MEGRIRLFGTELRELSAAFWASPQLPECYPRFLGMAYDVIRGTVPLMDEAREACLARREPGFSALADYLARHAVEERGHESWVLEDLESLGVSRETTLGRTPCIHAASLVGAHSYWIRYAHPVVILGFQLVIEGAESPDGFFEAIARRNQMPVDAFRALRFHSELDKGHADEMRRLLDVLPLDQSHLDLLSRSVLHTMHTQASMLKGLLEQPAGV